MTLVSDRGPAQRVRQGLVLLVGSVAFAVVVGTGPDTFFWTPLGIGAVYLAAAVSGGREGGYWSGALVLCGWGTAVAFAREADPDLDIAGLYMAGAGFGVTAAIALSRAGWNADALGAAVTVVIAGTILAVSAEWSQLTEARTYALFVGAVGLVNVLWGLVAESRSAGRLPGAPR